MQLIDREVLRERSMPVREFMRNNPDLHVVSLNQINRMLTVDAEPVRHGRWEYVRTPNGGRLQCMDCMHYIDAGNDKNFCPNCGAKMMEVQDDNT